MGLKNGTVILENKYLEWKNIFNNEQKFLKNIFGDLAIEIEHIGSTSVEGLSAKPIVDIAVAVNDFKDIEQIKNKLKLHYTVKENEDNGEILLIKEDTEFTYCLIHVMLISSKRYKDTINFRNCLRENKNILEEYELLKIKLSEEYKDDRKMYTKSKNDFIQKVLNKK